MGDPPVMNAELESITRAFTMAINALTAQVALLSTQVNNNANNNVNNNTNNNNMKNHNRGGGPIRVPLDENN